MKVRRPKNEGRKLLMAIGKRVRMIRKARGHTSWSLGAALGLSQAHVSRIETGNQGLRCIMILRMAKVLNVSPLVFFMEERQAYRLLKVLPEDEIRGVNLVCPEKPSRRTISKT
jgi:transcriptional regulator with XRE-family HTH domain